MSTKGSMGMEKNLKNKCKNMKKKSSPKTDMAFAEHTLPIALKSYVTSSGIMMPTVALFRVASGRTDYVTDGGQTVAHLRRIGVKNAKTFVKEAVKAASGIRLIGDEIAMADDGSLPYGEVGERLVEFINALYGEVYARADESGK